MGSSRCTQWGTPGYSEGTQGVLTAAYAWRGTVVPALAGGAGRSGLAVCTCARMCARVCVCVCMRGRESVCACVYERERVCIRVCACAGERASVRVPSSAAAIPQTSRPLPPLPHPRPPSPATSAGTTRSSRSGARTKHAEAVLSTRRVLGPTRKGTSGYSEYSRRGAPTDLLRRPRRAGRARRDGRAFLRCRWRRPAGVST
jgi:hypothetical protein